METVAAKLPKPLVKAVDAIVAAGSFPNRSEVVRVAIREFVEARRPVGRRRRSAEPPGGGTPPSARRLRALAKDPRYRNRFVALFQDRVLDSDENLQALVQRVLRRPEHPVHIERATERPERVKVRLPGVRGRPR